MQRARIFNLKKPMQRARPGPGTRQQQTLLTIKRLCICVMCVL